MGKITCHIKLLKPSDGVYNQGEVVSGVIKLGVLKPVEVQKITTSLKGVGNIVLLEHRSRNRKSYETQEVLVDIDDIIQDENIVMPCGSREIKFSFTLPNNIPSSMKISKFFGSFKATCVILYWICIQLEGSDFTSTNNHYKKEITVISDIVPTLSREPLIHVKSKKLMRLFASTDDLISIKATLLDSVLPRGGKILLHYEVKNNSHVTVKSILTKLIQAYTFKAEGRSAVTYEEDVPDTEVRTTSVDSKGTRTEFVDIHLRSNLYCVENSKIVSRYYVFRIIALLPFPHGNMVLDVPVQIGINENTDNNMFERERDGIHYNPPSYWEDMDEVQKENKDSSDDDNKENDKNKIEK